jgi:hypothetical protein
MTSTIPPRRSPFSPRPSRGQAIALSMPSGSSRDGGRVSQERDSSQQIQPHISGYAVQHGMIGAMHSLPHHLPIDWSADTLDDTSAYQSSYTVVYTQAKEVS